MIGGLGLTATKKIGNACQPVIGHGRRMRALARDHLSPLAKAGIDYVLIARHDTATANWQDMVNGLQKAIRYLHRTIGTGTNQNTKLNLKPMAGRQSQDDS
jgi:ribonuclease P protein component